MCISQCTSQTCDYVTSRSDYVTSRSAYVTSQSAYVRSQSAYVTESDSNNGNVCVPDKRIL